MYDIIVCGAGPAGMCAAVSAARCGSKVLLIESSGMLGGTNTLSLVGPLMTYHNRGKLIIGGIANEIVARLNQTNSTLGHLRDPLDFCDTITPVDPEALKDLYFKMISEEKIDLLLHTMLVDVQKEGKKVTKIVVANKAGLQELEAKVFVDCTGDGDLCYYAKNEFILGRSEDHLCQPMTMPFVVGGVDLDKVRCEMEKNPDNFVLGDDWDHKYIGVSGFFKEVNIAKENGDFDINRDRVLLFEDVKKNQVTINMTRVLTLCGVNPYERTKAEIEGRRQVKVAFNFLKKYIPGFENSYIVSTPTQIGIRETRHIVCDYMMNKEDIFALRKFDDAVCLGAFPMDIHSPTGADMEFDEVQNDKCYEIPFRSLIPVSLDNVLVAGRPIGCTHEAAASVRVSPVAMALGEVAGVAASLANDGIIRNVNYYELKRKLESAGAITKK